MCSRLPAIADQRRQACLDVQVDVFQVEFPFELAAFDFALDLGHAFLDRLKICIADDFLRSQHGGVSEGTLDIDEGQAFVEEHG